jgi:hypothetical protein
MCHRDRTACILVDLAHYPFGGTSISNTRCDLRISSRASLAINSSTPRLRKDSQTGKSRSCLQKTIFPASRVAHKILGTPLIFPHSRECRALVQRVIRQAGRCARVGPRVGPRVGQTPGR